MVICTLLPSPRSFFSLIAVLIGALTLTACDNSPYPDGVEVIPCKPAICEKIEEYNPDEVEWSGGRYGDLLELRSTFPVHASEETVTVRISFANIDSELPRYKSSLFYTSSIRKYAPLQRGRVQIGTWKPESFVSFLAEGRVSGNIVKHIFKVDLTGRSDSLAARRTPIEKPTVR